MKGAGRGSQQQAHTIAAPKQAASGTASPFGSSSKSRVPAVHLTATGTQALLKSSLFGRASSQQVQPPPQPKPQGEAAQWVTGATSTDSARDLRGSHTGGYSRNYRVT